MATLVQSTSAVIGASLPGNISLASAPTPGNLLVLAGWARGTGFPTLPAGFTESTRNTATLNLNLILAYRVVEAGDSAVWSTALAGARRYSLMEWSGLGAPDAVAHNTFAAGGYPTTAGGIVANPTGAGFTLALFGSSGGSVDGPIHVASPSTLIYEAPAEATGNGPYGSVGYGTGQAVATADATWQPYQAIGYVAAHYPSATIPVTIEVEIDDVDGVYLTTIARPLDWGIRVEEDGPGSGFLVVDRNDAQATAANLARGNFVRVLIPEIDPTTPVFEWIMEEGDFDLISSSEEGGEELRFGGSGSLKYLDYARLYEEEEGLDENIIVLADNVWRFSGQTVGRMVKKLLDEADARTNYLAASDPPMPLLTYTFGAVNDSAAAAWLTIAGLWEMQIGSSVYDEVMRFVGKDLAHVRMRPGLVLDMWEGDPGVNRTSTTFAANKVRFVKGVNISSEMKGQTHGGVWYTHAIVRAKADWIRVGLAAGTFDYRKETTLDYSGVTDTNTAARAAAGAFLHSDEAQTPYILEHITPHPGEDPDDALGLYLPGPPGSANGRYWVGDLVTLHTGGTGFGALSNVTQRVYAITLRPDEVGDLAPPIVELNAPYTSEADTSPLGGGQGGSSGGSSGGSAVHGHPQYELVVDHDAHLTDAVDAHDASAVSFSPAAGIAATDVQAAIVEDAGDLAAHLADTTDAHDASAISVLDTAGSFAGTDVEAVLAELDASISAGGIPATIVDAKGDLIVATAADTVARRAVGADGTVLTADAAEATGVKWATPGAGSGITTVDQDLGADQTTNNTSTWTDITGLTGIALTAGTWIAMVDIESECTTHYGPVFRVYDGTTVYAQAGLIVNYIATVSTHTHFASKPFVLGGSATMVVQYFTDTVMTIKKYPTRGASSTAVATHVTFLKIA